MNLRHELEILRRRFWNGDRAARDSLHHLLERYVAVFVRRALADRTADSPIARDARRIAAERRTSPDAGDRFDVKRTADELCRRLCDRLLLVVPPGGPPLRAVDTLAASLRTVAQRP